MAFGYVIYLFIALFTGDLISNMIDQYHYYSGYIPEPLRLPASLVPAASPRAKTPKKGSKSGKGNVNDQGEQSGLLVNTAESSDDLPGSNMFVNKFYKYMEMEDDEGAPRVEFG